VHAEVARQQRLRLPREEVRRSLLTGDGDAAPDAYAAARDAGVARYESEVRNRGSGAADPRCRTDAVAAAVRFRAVIDAE